MPLTSALYQFIFKAQKTRYKNIRIDLTLQFVIFSWKTNTNIAQNALCTHEIIYMLWQLKEQRIYPLPPREEEKVAHFPFVITQEL